MLTISIHAAREGGDVNVNINSRISAISIHAAREGGDGVQSVNPTFLRHISIHAAREGGDQYTMSCFKCSTIFQSTPPVKAATRVWRDSVEVYGISIHAAREGGDSIDVSPCAANIISIHAAREGGDWLRRFTFQTQTHFNPRRP